MRATVFGSRRERKKCRGTTVTLNGVDVTADCQEADDREGWALLLARNESGQHYFDPARDDVARAVHRGRVRIFRT